MKDVVLCGWMFKSSKGDFRTPIRRHCNFMQEDRGELQANQSTPVWIGNNALPQMRKVDSRGAFDQLNTAVGGDLCPRI